MKSGFKYLLLRTLSLMHQLGTCYRRIIVQHLTINQN